MVKKDVWTREERERPSRRVKGVTRDHKGVTGVALASSVPPWLH